ncbi:unnamed protein product [Rhizophagus irregularis]|nr:unnamed protein product [Rhizophagus irregularis]
MGFNRYEKMADELPKDVAKWSADDVETYLTFKMDKFDINDIKVIKDEGVDGEGLLQLDKGILTSKFKIKFMHAVAIMKLVKELNDKRVKEVEEQMESLSLDKTKKTPGVICFFLWIVALVFKLHRSTNKVINPSSVAVTIRLPDWVSSVDAGVADCVD